MTLPEHASCASRSEPPPRRLASGLARGALWVARQVMGNRKLFRLLGIVICVVILVRADLAKAADVVRSVDMTYLSLSLAAQALALVVSTWRWQLIMARLGVVIPLGRSFIYQLVGTAAGVVTPGQFGEFVKVLYQRRHGSPLGEAFLSILLDRLYDLVVLVGFGLLAIVSIWGMSTTAYAILAGVALLLFATAGLYARSGLTDMEWVGRLLIRVSPESYREAVRRDSGRLALHLRGLAPAFLAKCLVISVANYLVLLLRNFLLLFSLHIWVSPYYFAMVVPLMRLVGLLPISVSGIGTRDIAVIYLLGRTGVPQESALVLSVLGFLTLQLQALVGLVVWWRCPPQSVATGLPPAPNVTIGVRDATPVICGPERDGGHGDV